jgi:biopolymer transport protein ExbB/biopolymer transport protein TolQ
MWGQMGYVAKGIGVVLIIMSMWSFGVAIERYYTFSQAQKQSKMYAPQVAKHLKDGRLKDALSVSQAKTYQYSHLAKVVLSGLQEYQFQQDTGGGLSRDDVLDTVVGIITAFQGIAATGSGGLGSVSAGIAEALVETALGLVVAIPAVWMYNYFTGRLEYFNVEMDNSSSELVDYFIKKTA